MRRKRAAMPIAIVLMACSTAAAAHSVSVGKLVDGCTCFCIADGYFMTAGHCIDQCEFRLFLNGKHHDAKVIYQTALRDGPAVLYAPSTKGRCSPVVFSNRGPQRGERVVCYGYPGTSLSAIVTGSGKIVGQTVCDHGVKVNVASIPVTNGMSGCPLLTDRGTVVGILHGMDGNKSHWIDYDAMLSCIRTARTTDVGLHIGRLKFGFSCDGDRCYREPEAIEQYQPTVSNEPIDLGVAIENPEGGETPPAPAFDGGVEVSGGGEVDWGYVKFVVAASTDTPKILRVLNGPGQRIVDEVTKGKAKLDVVAQRTEPECYDKFTGIVGVNPDPLAVVVMVKQMDLGMKGKIAEIIEKRIRPALQGFERIPVDILFERAHPVVFANAELALNPTELDGYTRTENPGLDAVGVEGIAKKVLSSTIGGKLDELEAKINEKKEEKQDEPVSWFYGLLAGVVPFVRRYLDNDAQAA